VTKAGSAATGDGAARPVALAVRGPRATLGRKAVDLRLRPPNAAGRPHCGALRLVNILRPTQ
jgi:hypothetical protein